MTSLGNSTEEIVLGVFGDIFQTLVFLAPIPTFWTFYQEKSTVGYPALPYITTLLSSMLWLFYSFIKLNSFLLMILNLIGCAIEIVYTSMFIYYSTRRDRIKTLIALAVALVIFFIVLLVEIFFIIGIDRIIFVGVTAMVFNVPVFGAPLAAVAQVVRTRDVRYRPFSLSFLLTITAAIRFGYGFTKETLIIMIPHSLGTLLGLIQLVVYGLYRNAQERAAQEPAVQEPVTTMEMVVTEAVVATEPINTEMSASESVSMEMSASEPVNTEVSASDPLEEIVIVA